MIFFVSFRSLRTVRTSLMNILGASSFPASGFFTGVSLCGVSLTIGAVNLAIVLWKNSPGNFLDFNLRFYRKKGSLCGAYPFEVLLLGDQCKNHLASGIHGNHRSNDLDPFVHDVLHSDIYGFDCRGVGFRRNGVRAIGGGLYH